MTYMASKDIRALLRERFKAPAHAIFFEVSDATGARQRGWADAISMSLWPSHGLELQGFEIKISRADWQREIADPSKAERFAARCDRWWIVATEGCIRSEEEVPAGWGWMQAKPDGLLIKRQAPKLEPEALDRNFLVSLVRSMGKIDEVEIEAMVSKRLATLREHDEAEITRRVERRRERDHADAEVMARVREVLKDADHDRLGTWLSEPDVAAAIVAVYRSGVAGAYSGLVSAATTLEKAAAAIRAAHTDLALPVPEAEPARRRKRVA